MTMLSIAFLDLMISLRLSRKSMWSSWVGDFWKVCTESTVRAAYGFSVASSLFFVRFYFLLSFEECLQGNPVMKKARQTSANAEPASTQMLEHAFLFDVEQFLHVCKFTLTLGTFLEVVEDVYQNILHT